MNQKKVCVLGAHGFIGKHLSKRLKELNYDVTEFGREEIDLENSNVQEQLGKLKKFDFIFHLPSIHGAGGWPAEHKGEIFERNVTINHNVFMWWRKCQPSAKIICCVSSCSYAESNLPLTEEDYWSGKQHASVATFGFTKRLMVAGLEAFQSQYGMKGVGVVFGTIYGPGADFFSDKAHVINALIGRFFNALKNGTKSIEIWGDGNQVREFVYISDQIESLIRCAEREIPILLNCSPGSGITIRKLVSTIAEVCGYKGEIQFNPNQFKGVEYKVLDISLAKKLLGWTTDYSLTPLPEGIAKTFDYLHKTVK